MVNPPTCTAILLCHAPGTAFRRLALNAAVSELSRKYPVTPTMPRTSRAKQAKSTIRPVWSRGAALGCAGGVMERLGAECERHREASLFLVLFALLRLVA